MTVYARNFKTRDTEREIEKSVPDSDELNAKLQQYVETVKVSSSARHNHLNILARSVKDCVLVMPRRLPGVGVYLHLLWHLQVKKSRQYSTYLAYCRHTDCHAHQARPVLVAHCRSLNCLQMHGTVAHSSSPQFVCQRSQSSLLLCRRSGMRQTKSQQLLQLGWLLLLQSGRFQGW